MDVILIILVIAIILVAFIFKDFKSVIYFLGITEILFRLLHKLKTLLNIKIITSLINKYIPESLEQIINNYSDGILNTILVWILFLIFIYFEVYLIKYWIKKKK